MGTWFDKLYDEFHDRGEVMFAFDRSQVEREGVTWEDFQANWYGVGAGLYVKGTARDEFLRRMEADFEADQATLPELRVTYVGTDSWDRPLYRDENGRHLVDVNYAPRGEAVELHTMVGYLGEPDAPVAARLVFADKEG